METIKETVEAANKKLETLVKGGFPFTFDEVKITVERDSAGVYVHSGKTPVGAVVRHSNFTETVQAIKAAIWATVDATNVAISRRHSLKEEAEKLIQEDEQHAKAKAALTAAGISVDVIDGDVNAYAAAEMATAAMKAVREANKGLFMSVGGLTSLRDAKMTVKAYHGGLVVSAGGKACLVTRFPKVINNRGLERTIAFIRADVAAINESRRRYFEKVRRVADTECGLRDISREIDRAKQRMAAAM